MIMRLAKVFSYINLKQSRRTSKAMDEVSKFKTSNYQIKISYQEKSARHKHRQRILVKKKQEQ